MPHNIEDETFKRNILRWLNLTAGLKACENIVFTLAKVFVIKKSKSCLRNYDTICWRCCVCLYSCARFRVKLFLFTTDIVSVSIIMFISSFLTGKCFETWCQNWLIKVETVECLACCGISQHLPRTKYFFMLIKDTASIVRVNDT